MKKFFFLTCMMLSGVMAFAQTTKKVAILEVVDREGRLSYSQKLVLRSNMARAVSNTLGYEAYDRTDVDVIMSEHDFQRTGLVKTEEIRRLGEMTGVSLILVTEGVLTGNNGLFVTAKVLNVETARVEIMDNIMMTLDADEMQKGCARLTTRLFGVTSQQDVAERYNVTKTGINEYICNGKYMNAKEYEYFLRNNCSSAYQQYRKGKNLVIAGWSLLGCGMASLGVGIILLSINGKVDSTGGVLPLAIGVHVVGGGVLLFALGNHKKNSALDIYNEKCASSAAKPVTFNLTAGQNGLGIAMNF